MLSTNCAYCGAVNQGPAQICVACGDDLTLQTSSAGPDQTAEWQPQIDPDRPLSSIGPFGVDTAISETLSLFGANFWLITRIVVVTVAPFEIFRALHFADITRQWELSTWSFLLNGVCKVLVVPALIYALMKVILTGKEAGVHESYRWGLNKLAKLTVCAIILGVLQAIGYALLVIPGIIVSVVFTLVYPIAVLEKGSVTEVFGRSLELTRGHRIQIVLAWIVMGIPLIIASALGTFIIGVSGSWLPMAIVAILGDILNQTATIMSLVLYLSLPRNSASGGSNVLSLSN